MHVILDTPATRWAALELKRIVLTRADIVPSHVAHACAIICPCGKKRLIEEIETSMVTEVAERVINLAFDLFDHSVTC